MVGPLIALALSVPAPSAAQSRIPSYVRVVTPSERVMRWLGPATDVLVVLERGTTLEVLDFDRDKDWYWVVLPPDLHGSRKVGWIRGSGIEPAEPRTAPAADAPFPGGTPRATAASPAPASAANAPAVDEDKVSVTIRREETPASPAAAATPPKSYTFEDVHFDRDGASVRREDADKLRVAAAALKDDPSLVVTIEGHTCNLGTAAHNLALGDRRANAVKEFLVSAGAPAERLLTVSEGEAGAQYDNSREETRRLNRRVALVPKVPR